ncbi:uncharacterized protein LOC122505043 [Leptopilina heterotoma]|uniref:uncharacterized protein LOC122505043 n=1 Tax=Leptopilina heterotoma TaxID=63436 RepID=UPI001CA8A919|nr:uncharacterized protein LOC122505043 [Leptopilina heterotoma]
MYRQPPEIGSSLNFNSMRSSIFRRSENKLPNIPKYLTDFENVLKNNFEPTKSLFRGIVEVNDGSAAAIFGSDLMISLLNSCDTKKVDIDATFSVSPRQMSIYQLYTVHIQNRGTVSIYENKPTFLNKLIKCLFKYNYTVNINIF